MLIRRPAVALEEIAGELVYLVMSVIGFGGQKLSEEPQKVARFVGCSTRRA